MNEPQPAIQHAPGPWRASVDRMTVLDSRGKVVSRATYRPESFANVDLIATAPELFELARRYEAWEAKLILESVAWEDGLPRFTQALYDEWMEIQTLRNAALTKATGGEAPDAKPTEGGA